MTKLEKLFYPTNCHLHKRTSHGAVRGRCEWRDFWDAPHVSTIDYSWAVTVHDLQASKFSADVERKKSHSLMLLLHHLRSSLAVQDQLNPVNMTSNGGLKIHLLCLSEMRSSGYAKPDWTANTVMSSSILWKNLSIINTSEYTAQLFFHIMFVKLKKIKCQNSLHSNNLHIKMF